MRLDLAKVLEEGGVVGETVPLGTMESEQGGSLETGPAVVRGRVTRASRGYEFDASLETSITLECVRCLEPFSQSLAFEFHLLFVSRDDEPHGGENQIQSADCDICLCEEGRVDLTAVAREQVYLHIPLKPVCTETCRGLCITCGENLNAGRCRCNRPEAVPVV